MAATALDYLDFDYSEDDEGTGTWDAMACPQPHQLQALYAEIEQLLRWAYQQFPGRCAPRDEGGDWDWELQAQHADGAPLALAYDRTSARLQAASAAPGERITVTLTLSGSPAFAEALQEAFAL
jgi:hypothetical protein